MQGAFLIGFAAVVLVSRVFIFRKHKVTVLKKVQEDV